MPLEGRAAGAGRRRHILVLITFEAASAKVAVTTLTGGPVAFF
jgi:hypothetical protein